MRRALGSSKAIDKLRTIGRAAVFIRRLREAVRSGTKRGKSSDEVSLLEKRLRKIRDADRAALLPLADARDPLWQLGLREHPRQRPWPHVQKSKNFANLPDEQVKVLRRQLAELKNASAARAERSRETAGEIDRLKAENSRLSSDLERAAAEQKLAETRLAEMTRIVADLNAQLASRADEISKLEKERGERISDLESQLRT